MKTTLRAFSLLFVSAFMMQAVSLSLIEIQFNSNHSYIASSLCENRNNPQMHCDGKCYLKKELTHQQEQQNSSQRNVQQNFSFNFFFEETEAYHYFSQADEIISSVQPRFLSSGFRTTNERPPTLPA